MAGKRREVRKTAASDFLKAAWGHRNAAELLEAHTGVATSKPNATFFAFYNVLGLALELYLKGFLRTTGMDAYTIGQTYGHKLDELLRDSLASGLLKIPAPTRIPFSAFNLQKLIDTINPYYSSHLYPGYPFHSGGNHIQKKRVTALPHRVSGHRHVRGPVPYSLAVRQTALDRGVHA